MSKDNIIDQVNKLEKLLPEVHKAQKESSNAMKKAMKYISIVKKRWPKLHEEVIDEMDGKGGQ